MERKPRKSEKKIEDDSEENLDQMSLQAFKHKFMRKSPLDDINFDEIIKYPKKLNEILKNRKGNMTNEEKIVSLIRDGVKLAYTIAGQNVTNFDNKTIKLVSPRFLGITKENVVDDEVGI